MSDIILPSKLEGERVSAHFNFLDLMEFGDAIADASVIASVMVGVDSSPERILLKAPSLTSHTVTQVLHRGLPGVIYNLQCIATTVLGDVVSKEALLAVLPNPAVYPPLFGAYFTSQPYAVEALEYIQASAEVPHGRMIFNIDQDAMSTSASIVSGTLIVLYQVYNYSDTGLKVTSTIASGTLAAVIKTHSYQEGINATAIPVSGTLVVLLIAYTTWPAEGMSVTSDLASGTLS